MILQTKFHTLFIFWLKWQGIKITSSNWISFKFNGFSVYINILSYKIEECLNKFKKTPHRKFEHGRRHVFYRKTLNGTVLVNGMLNRKPRICLWALLFFAQRIFNKQKRSLGFEIYSSNIESLIQNIVTESALFSLLISIFLFLENLKKQTIEKIALIIRIGKKNYPKTPECPEDRYNKKLTNTGK